MALDATVGGPDANSFATVAEADAYFAERLHTSAWDALTAGDKEKALIWSTRVITSKVSEDWTKKDLPRDAVIRVLSDIKPDSQCYLVWTGRPASETQALPWPRSGMKSLTGFDFPSDEVPQQLKEFQFEAALKLSAEDRTEENAATAQGLSSLEAGPVKLAWNKDAPNPQLIPNVLFKLLVPSWWYAFELREKRLATISVV